MTTKKGYRTRRQGRPRSAGRPVNSDGGQKGFVSESHGTQEIHRNDLRLGKKGKEFATSLETLRESHHRIPIDDFFLLTHTHANDLWRYRARCVWELSRASRINVVVVVRNLSFVCERSLAGRRPTVHTITFPLFLDGELLETRKNGLAVFQLLTVTASTDSSHRDRKTKESID